MSAKMGRPKVPKGQQKIPFPIRFERDALKAFKRAARTQKMSVTEWVTSTLTKALNET